MGQVLPTLIKVLNSWVSYLLVDIGANSEIQLIVSLIQNRTDTATLNVN